MATLDEDRFRIRPGPPKARGPRPQRFVSQVLKQLSRAGANASGARGTRSDSTFGRGRVAASMVARALGPQARRVVIKSRFVVLKKAGANVVSIHLRYIIRDGVTREGEPGQAYGPDADTADLKAFEERGKGDRHQFRFIVSAEDAEQLEDLRTYTRSLLQRMSIDLETRLDWVAIDHWDTDNAHTHVVLRGRASNGQDLVIAPDYMAHGMRQRAVELATEWLGLRTELEIRQGLLREVEQERLTSLDRSLLRQATVDVVDLTESSGERQRQTMLRARLQRLETMGLVRRVDAHRWQLSPRLEPTLTALGARGDILRTMQNALRGQPRECVLGETEPIVPVTGRVAAKGLADELNDRGYIVVDGIDGRAHYVALNAGTDLGQFPVGGIVRARSASDARASDKTVVGLARDGLYRVDAHLLAVRRRPVAHRDPNDVVATHVRRLEALRRAGIVERLSEGVWRIPDDLPERGRQYDAQRTGSATVELQSQLPIELQTRVIGVTWLDRQLIGEAARIGASGFGAEVREGLRRRADFLVEEGLAERHDGRVVLARNLLATLRGRDIDAAAKVIATETGLTHHPVVDGERVAGVYRRSVLLASGRFAMLDNGMGFSLVPWRPVIAQRLGKTITAVVRGGAVSWDFGRQRGPVIGNT